jgi:hypothetical protein
MSLLGASELLRDLERSTSARLRIAIASESVLKPMSCSASPEIGSTRETEPRPMISWSYSTESLRPSGVMKPRRRAIDSAPVTRPSRMSVHFSSSRSGTTT